MASEGAPPPNPQEGKERPQRGDLRYLWHPDTSDHFAGCGLVVRPDQPGHLVGLLMVDDRQLASPAWLQQIEDLYGSCQLVPATETGERALLCQMRVTKEGQRFLRPLLHHPNTEMLHRSLQPLLNQLPHPILKCDYDPHAHQWHTDFWIGLPAGYQALFEKSGYGCMAVEQDDGAGFIVWAADSNIARLRDAPVTYEWELVLMPTAPLIRFHAATLKKDGEPYLLEHFLNVDSSTDARLLSQFARQEELVFYFFGQEYEFQLRQALTHPADMRHRLHHLVAQAVDYAGKLPPEKRDFEGAKSEFQRRWPLWPAS